MASSQESLFEDTRPELVFQLLTTRDSVTNQQQFSPQFRGTHGFCARGGGLALAAIKSFLPLSTPSSRNERRMHTTHLPKCCQPCAENFLRTPFWIRKNSLRRVMDPICVIGTPAIRAGTFL